MYKKEPISEPPPPPNSRRSGNSPHSNIIFSAIDITLLALFPAPRIHHTANIGFLMWVVVVVADATLWSLVGFFLFILFIGLRSIFPFFFSDIFSIQTVNIRLGADREKRFHFHDFYFLHSIALLEAIFERPCPHFILSKNKKIEKEIKLIESSTWESNWMDCTWFARYPFHLWFSTQYSCVCVWVCLLYEFVRCLTYINDH